MSVTMYHNPRCSKSRETLSLLNEKGIEPEIIEYLNSPPDATQLKKILGLLGLSPREIIRTKDDLYKELNLDNEGLDDNQIIAALIENPILIERPIVLANGKAAIGRPPENILVIL
ncbi:MAG: arsenate reductase (glutaredoxin) [Gammaproteobacteria bacterium]|jgi:arsenate reductase